LPRIGNDHAIIVVVVAAELNPIQRKEHVLLAEPEEAADTDDHTLDPAIIADDDVVDVTDILVIVAVDRAADEVGCHHYVVGVHPADGQAGTPGLRGRGGLDRRAVLPGLTGGRLISGRLSTVLISGRGHRGGGALVGVVGRRRSVLGEGHSGHHERGNRHRGKNRFLHADLLLDCELHREVSVQRASQRKARGPAGGSPRVKRARAYSWADR
jgi:hypothetical protein